MEFLDHLAEVVHQEWGHHHSEQHYHRAKNPLWTLLWVEIAQPDSGQSRKSKIRQTNHYPQGWLISFLLHSININEGLLDRLATLIRFKDAEHIPDQPSEETQADHNEDQPEYLEQDGNEYNFRQFAHVLVPILCLDVVLDLLCNSCLLLLHKLLLVRLIIQ